MLDARSPHTTRNQPTRLARAARALATATGLAAVSLFAGGCSLLPFGGKDKAPQALRPEFHEVASNNQEACLAEGESAAKASAPQAAPVPVTAGCTACKCKGDTSTVALAEPAPLHTTDPIAPATPADEELQRLMDGNKRFVEGEAENVYKWPQRPGDETAKRPPAAMVLACSDWGILPEAAFDTRAGDLFVVQVAGAVTDNSVIESAKYAVQQYDIPLIIVLGHESCGAVEASLLMNTGDNAEGRQARANKLVPAREAEARPAHDAEGAPEPHGGGFSDGNPGLTPIDRAAHANVSDAVQELTQADPAIAKRVATGKLKIVGAFYDESNGQITLQPEEAGHKHPETITPGEQFADTPRE